MTSMTQAIRKAMISAESTGRQYNVYLDKENNQWKVENLDQCGLLDHKVEKTVAFSCDRFGSMNTYGVVYQVFEKILKPSFEYSTLPETTDEFIECIKITLHENNIDPDWFSLNDYRDWTEKLYDYFA